MDVSVSSLKQLTTHNVEDIIEAFRLERIPGAAHVARVAMRYPAQHISRHVLEYDARIDEQGLLNASRWLVETFTSSLTISGIENIPDKGPLLLTSNHPGMVDAMAIFSSLPRTDLRIIAKDRALLMLLNGVKRHLIFTTDHSDQRMSALRESLRHLRTGGSLLLFPAGQIEPDPALRETAPDTLVQWSESVDLLARRIPDLTVLPIAVSGVISPQAARHPLTALYQTQERRDWVAATLMILWSQYRQVDVRVQYGEPIRAASAASTIETVREQMRELYARVRQ